MMNFAYIGAILILMTLSFLFSGTETGVYRISRFRLRFGAEQKKKQFKHLFRIIQDGQNLILSLLLGNNLVNYLLTTLFTIFVYQNIKNETMAELYTSLILTPVVFIFCEMMPKNIFYHKSDTLMPRLSGFLTFVYTFFTRTGLLSLFKYLFKAVNRLFGLSQNTAQAVDKTQRLQVFQILHETQEEGLLSDVQKDMIHRLINIPDISLNSVMIPISAYGKAPVGAGRQELLDILRAGNFRHYLVYDGSPTNIIGHISLEEVLAGNDNINVINFIKPILKINRTASVIEAISIIRKKRERIAMVVDISKGHSSPVGVITVSDLIEELTGEIRI